MQARIDNPAVSLQGVLPALNRLAAASASAEIPHTTLSLVDLRASQINGCSVCIDIHTRELALLGESAARIALVAAWRESPYYSDEERAALALTEAATRLSDRSDPVGDDVWAQAALHYSDEQLAALVVRIATINAYNRINIATGQITGEWVEQIAEQTTGVSRA